MSKKIEYIILYNDRHEEYDLFADLKGRDDVHLVVTHFKPVKTTIGKYLRKIHLSRNIADCITLPFKKKWYEKVHIRIEEDVQYYFIVFDMAIATVPVSYLKSITKRSNVKSVLIMVNSAGGAIIRHAQKEINKIKWDAIYTFDDEDAKKYSYRRLGNCYYSKHTEEELKHISTKGESDLYYVGSLVPNRKKLIISVYERLKNGKANVEYHLMKTGKERYEKFPYENEIDYFTTNRGFIPYKQVLASVLNTNTILEIVQATQSGPSLRYYEAVCYNKKLLTNNPHIINFPFYDNRYMKVFTKPEDIDVDWVKEEAPVDYHYNNEFSPINLLDKVKEI